MIPRPKRFFSVMGGSVLCFAFTGMSPGYGFSAKGPGELWATGSTFLYGPYVDVLLERIIDFFPCHRVIGRLKSPNTSFSDVDFFVKRE